MEGRSEGGSEEIPVMILEHGPGQTARDPAYREHPSGGPQPHRDRLGLPANVQRMELHPTGHPEKMDKDRTSVTNYLRLLKLPQEIRDSLVEENLSVGHARALLALEEPEVQLAAFRQIIDKGLLVRNTEKLVNRMKERPPRAQRSLEDPDLHALQEELLKMLGTKVVTSGNREKVPSRYFIFLWDDLNRIFARIKGAS